jgi:alkylhydroperoxidase/carboxymuconolactone decarboxylase family protein YurZ
MDRPGGDQGGSVRTDEARLLALAATWDSQGFSPFDVLARGLESCSLDGRTDALVRLAALVAMRAPASSFRHTVEDALDAGAREDEVIGTLIAVAPTVGLSRVVNATVALGLALGYDIDAALEERDPPASGSASHSLAGEVPVPT